MPSKPIRILHLIASNFVGGPEKQILHHAKDMSDWGFEVFIGSFHDQSDKPEILQCAEQSGLQTYESRSSGRFDARAIFELKSFLKRHDIQLLCTHGFKANTIGSIAKKLAGVPQIAFCRGWTAETLRIRAYEFLDRRFLRLADRIVCVSEAQAKYLASRGLRHPRVAVAHNAMLESSGEAVLCDRAEAKKLLGFSPGTKLIGTVGRLSAEKGQRFLLEAAAELARDSEDLRFVLLGEGRERANLELQAKRLGIEDIVILPGFQKNVSHWMRAFDVLANCSLTEGIPNAVLEAMAAGTPVVATAVGGVPEIIKDQESGLLVAAADSSALGRGLAEILRDNRKAATLASAGRIAVETNFSVAGQREALLKIYRECLGIATDLAPEQASNGGKTSRVDPLLAAPNPSKSEASGTGMLPLISVVIPVRNEAAHIASLLEMLRGQDYPQDRFEILVADGLSTDGTQAIVERIGQSSGAKVTLVSNPRRLSSAGRNLGVRHSSGDLIVFIDGHCQIPSKSLLRDAAEILIRTRADCLCRPQPLTMTGNSELQDVIANARATAFGHGRDSTIYITNWEGEVNPSSSGAMYRRSVFDQIGFYDESFDACEDVEFNYRVFKAGLRSYLSPRLTVVYQPRSSLRALWRQMMRYGRGRARLIRKHPDAFSAAQTLPAILLLGLILGGTAALFWAPAGIAFFALAGIYFLLALFFSAKMALAHGWRHLVWGLLVYPTIHFGLGAGFLVENFELRLVQSRKTGVVFTP
jgi:glycosyltransferase involved in cell wall biosynthesis/GT2 family glycosyltransferase